MKLTWNKKNPKKRSLSALSSNLPFDNDSPPPPATQSHRQNDSNLSKQQTSDQFDSLEIQEKDLDLESKNLADSFRSQGDKLAEEGKYQEALGKWEAALNILPDNAVLHEQKAQVLLELGDAWKALKAATRATEIDPSWAEAWITLGRAQLNFGEPDSAIKSFESALSINADSKEAKDDLLAAKQLIKKREQLQTSGQDIDTKRFVVGDKRVESQANEQESCT